MKITVAGIGYVGLSNAVLLAQNNEVVAVDINKEKVNLINDKKSPIKDNEIEYYLSKKNLNLTATLDYNNAYENSEYIIISTPTNYDEQLDFFDTSSIEKVLEDILQINKIATIIIKSTVPIGYTERLRKKYKTDNIIFSPEFLREGKALYDNLYPSRIVIGDKSERAKIFVGLLKEAAIKKDIQVIYTNSTEAEAIKLFSNAYLALRVAYFNEIDTYCEMKKLNAKDIIEGVGLDPRIGDHYNNPSFGYGGYCLPKDSKQLKATYSNIPNNIITAIVDSNETRKNYITSVILAKKPKVVGIYRLIMKKDSDNFREAAIWEVIKKLQEENINIIIYEPNLTEEDMDKAGHLKMVKTIEQFKEDSEIILANRLYAELNDVENKVYTRDLFYRD